MKSGAEKELIISQCCIFWELCELQNDSSCCSSFEGPYESFLVDDIQLFCHCNEASCPALPVFLHCARA